MIEVLSVLSDSGGRLWDLKDLAPLLGLPSAKVQPK